MQQEWCKASRRAEQCLPLQQDSGVYNTLAPPPSPLPRCLATLQQPRMEATSQSSVQRVEVETEIHPAQETAGGTLQLFVAGTSPPGCLEAVNRHCCRGDPELAIIYAVLANWLPGGSLVNNPIANAGDSRDSGSIPGSGRYPGGGNGNPHQYSCLENSMDRGAWWATVHGAEKNQTQLSDWAHTHRVTLFNNFL